MKRKGFHGVVLLLALSLFILILAGTARAADCGKMLQDRSARLWLEGETLGSMVIGARARLDFIYVDRELARVLAGDPKVPEWISWHAQHFGSPETEGKALFILRFETRKPWDFRVGGLVVGDYYLREEDVLTRFDFMPTGPLPGGTEGTLAFAVPGDALGQGKTVPLGYADERVDLYIPGR